MAWEVDSERELPCPCGASTYMVVRESNDWGGHQEHRRMNCPECRASYELEIFTYREGARQFARYRWKVRD